MSYYSTVLLICLINFKILHAQYFVGVGAALHRYDQVISVKGIKVFSSGGLGLELGCGVERSLQGALTPQLAMFWQATLPLKNRHYLIKLPFYSLRYQFDFQKAGFLDTYHGIYLGMGYALDSEARLQLQLGLGVVVEKMYIPNTSTSQTHSFLNPQVQLNYYFRNHSK